MRRTHIRAVAWALVAVATGVPAAGQDGPDRGGSGLSTQIEPVIATLEVQLEVVRTLLDRAVREYQASVRRRDSVRAVVVQAEAEMDRLVVSEADVPGALERGLERLDAAEGAMAEARQRVDRSLVRVLALRTERRELEDKLRALRAGLPAEAGALSGTWEVSILPGDLQGEFHLRQAGTLVTGEYRLSGGWSGSLQGTFVDGRVYLERIDSKRGRDAEYRGTLAVQAGRIRGTWQEFELSDGQAPHGSWIAVRRR